MASHVSEKDWAHFPCHEDQPADEHGIVWTQPKCRCGWARKALYQRDELLVHAYSVHLNAIRLGSENRRAIALAEKEGQC